MPSQPSQPARIPLARAIDHCFELALYLLVLTGFGTLASTGGLDLPSVVLVGAALAVRGYLLAKGQPFVISVRWDTPLTIAYFVFFTADYFIVSHSFLPATVHLTLFGVVVRTFSLRRNRDHIMLAVLAFLMVLASAVLTVDSVFLFSFACFLLAAIATFVLMEMRRSGHAASIQARPSSDPLEHRRLAFSLARLTPALMMFILAVGAVLFFMIPRRPGGYLGGFSFGTDFSSGFSDRVQLGQIGQIQQSHSVVMHVQIDGDTTGRHDLHWRGVALANFDGHSWSKTREQAVGQPLGNTFAIPRLENPTLKPLVSIPEHLIRYRVLMEPIGTNVFFLAPKARSLSGSYRLLAVDRDGAVYNQDTQRAISRYEAESDIATPTPAELKAAESMVPPLLDPAYLDVPTLDPRLARLAVEISGGAGDNFDKAAAIERFLKTHYGYTLDLPRTPSKDPIANFLFERKQGHCEYFASAMAVLLRIQGIPSRVVTGFRSDEFNDLTANYVVRAKDAHAWVEAYFPGYGWQTFDPTPGGGASTPQGWARVGLYLDAVSSFWRDWIVSYDTSHQYVLSRTALNGTRDLWDGAHSWARRHYDSMLRWSGKTQARITHAPGTWTAMGLALATALLLLGNVRRVARLVHERRFEAHPERSPAQAAAMWYGRMACALERRGVRKTSTQTPQEFLRKINEDRLRDPVARFTQVYQSARFGNSADDARRLPALYEEVESATREQL